jgi:hypothetical protein
VSSKVIEIFEDEILRERIKNKLPHLFSIAELESSRGWKDWDGGRLNTREDFNSTAYL